MYLVQSQVHEYLHQSSTHEMWGTTGRSSILVQNYHRKFIDMHSATVESYLIIYEVIRTVLPGL
jgi:hypothetical protein